MSPKNFAGMTAGKDQTIVFAPFKNMKISDGPVVLKAISDSGLPVEFYVAHDPAAIVDGKVRIAEVPLRATFPSRSKLLPINSAEDFAPVEQTFMLENRSCDRLSPNQLSPTILV